MGIGCSDSQRGKVEGDQVAHTNTLHVYDKVHKAPYEAKQSHAYGQL